MNTELYKYAYTPFTPFTLSYCVSGAVMTAGWFFIGKNKEYKTGVGDIALIIIVGSIWGPNVIFPTCGAILGSLFY